MTIGSDKKTGLFYEKEQDCLNSALFFFSTANEISQDILEYISLTEALGDKQIKLLGEVELVKENQLRSSIDNDLAEVSSKQLAIKERIYNLKYSMHSTTNDRTDQENKLQSLKSHFLQAIKKHQSSQFQFSQKSKAKLAKQYEILETPESSQGDGNEVFAQAILGRNLTSASPLKAASKTLDSVNIREAELQKIEKLMQDLNQLFLEMENFVVEQKQTVENVESHTNSAEKYISVASSNLDHAIVSASKSRRIWAMILSGVLFSAIGFAIALTIHIYE